MTRKGIILISIAILVVGLVIGGIVACAPKEKEVTKEVPMTLPTLAQKIREGKIEVGKDHTLGLTGRYHKIHATVLGLECATCHVTNPDTTQTVFNAQDVSPQAPGPVDKRACLGCHRAGPGKNIYGSSSP